MRPHGVYSIKNRIHRRQVYKVAAIVYTRFYIDYIAGGIFK